MRHYDHNNNKKYCETNTSPVVSVKSDLVWSRWIILIMTSGVPHEVSTEREDFLPPLKSLIYPKIIEIMGLFFEVDYPKGFLAARPPLHRQTTEVTNSWEGASSDSLYTNAKCLRTTTTTSEGANQNRAVFLSIQLPCWMSFGYSCVRNGAVYLVIRRNQVGFPVLWLKCSRVSHQQLSVNTFNRFPVQTLFRCWHLHKLYPPHKSLETIAKPPQRQPEVDRALKSRFTRNRTCCAPPSRKCI